MGHLTLPVFLLLSAKIVTSLEIGLKFFFLLTSVFRWVDDFVKTVFPPPPFFEFCVDNVSAASYEDMRYWSNDECLISF